MDLTMIASGAAEIMIYDSRTHLFFPKSIG